MSQTFWENDFDVSDYGDSEQPETYNGFDLNGYGDSEQLDSAQNMESSPQESPLQASYQYPDPGNQSNAYGISNSRQQAPWFGHGHSMAFPPNAHPYASTTHQRDAFASAIGTAGVNVGEEIFWNAPSTFHWGPTGEALIGSNAQVHMQHPNMRPRLEQALKAWRDRRDGTQTYVGQSRTPQLYDAQNDPLSNNALPVHNTYSKHSEDRVPNTRTPNSAIASQGPRTASTADTSVQDATESPKKRKRRVSTVSDVEYNTPAYTPDAELASPSACLEFLTFGDIHTFQKLEIPNDDLEHVKEHRVEEFVGKIFEALAEAFAEDPPHPITLSLAKQERYIKQQESHRQKVSNSLSEPTGMKSAKAQCRVLFETVVLVHQKGVPAKDYEQHQRYVSKDLTVPRQYRLDLNSILSSRLEKVVNAVSGNKLVACDVLKGTNFARIARDPKWYLEEKFHLLKSNTTRQAKIEKLNAGTKGKKTQSRSARKTQQGAEGNEREGNLESSDSEEDANVEPEVLDDEEYEPRKKRVRS